MFVIENLYCTNAKYSCVIFFFEDKTMDSVWILTWNPSGFPVGEGLDAALLLCNEPDKREMFQFQKLYKKNPRTVFSTTLPRRFRIWGWAEHLLRLRLYGHSNCFLILHMPRFATFQGDLNKSTCCVSVICLRCCLSAFMLQWGGNLWWRCRLWMLSRLQLRWSPELARSVS